MGSIASLIAEGIPVPSYRQRQLETEKVAQAQAGTQAMGIENQQRNVALQQQQQDLKDQQAMSKALLDSLDDRGHFDPGKAADNIVRYGGSAKAFQSFMKGQADYVHTMSQADKAKRETEEAHHKRLMEGMQAVEASPEETRPQAWQAMIEQIAPEVGPEVVKHLPPTYPGPEGVKLLYGGVGMFDDHLKQIAAAQKLEHEKQAEARAVAEEARKAAAVPETRAHVVAQTKLAEAQTEAAKNKPVSVGTPEQQYIVEYQRLHPGATTEAAIRAYTQIQGAPARAEGATRAANARADRSYQFATRELDQVGKPIADAVARMGRLKDTLAQGTPQADALVAPELLTVMAGGAGSGLRMNEAEIARIIGGRSKWESLRAAAQKWSLDPKSATSITPEQREQIRTLVNEVDTRLRTKQQVIDQATQELVGSDDPLEHRKVVAATRKKLTEADQAPGIAAIGTSKPIVQHSASTGAYRYSMDGGKTWQPGQPPAR